MPDDLQAIIIAVLARAPQWIRQDLVLPEPGIRVRAEETLAAMIEQAIRDSAAR
ncbi:hypothetical protein M0208_02780 [Sphingomonas sp. SUN019]|uniref:hypothetical protein n=1 Tax=Sphingomonas sp. SUN019 TaxID=2937788 RepID=UPI00216482CB|nr:hypothetical protein [Sphingomonas sp. SUN019]UVO49488.1 hypothetical protein M0208_02780 [Sphingomonas sp. SUN019]